MPDTPNNREGPWEREPTKCLNGQSSGERLAKQGFWSPATRGSERDSDRTMTPMVEEVHLPAHLAPPGSPEAKQLHLLHAQPSLGQSGHRPKSIASIHAGLPQSCPTIWDPMDCGLPGLSVRGFSRQEYWSVLANTGCHTLLEHSISHCPSCQPPSVTGAARSPVIQAAAPTPHLSLTVANPSPPGQPQEQSPVDDPHAEVEIKPQWNPGAVWLRKKTQTFPPAVQTAD